jgi:hypothetical protein
VAGRDLWTRLPVQVPVALVLVIAASGMVRVLTQHWREGAVLLGGALLVAATLRVLLPDDRAGLLAVRGRVIDVLCYSGLGIVMVALAVTITRNPLMFV